ncbi:hypothetical protein AAY473_011207, partial [Plecturocebus cupreus]
MDGQTDSSLDFPWLTQLWELMPGMQIKGPSYGSKVGERFVLTPEKSRDEMNMRHCCCAEKPQVELLVIHKYKHAKGFHLEKLGLSEKATPGLLMSDEELDSTLSDTHTRCPISYCLGLETSFALTAQAGVQWRDLSSTHCNLRLPSSNDSSALASHVAGITGTRHDAWLTFCIFGRDMVSTRDEFHHVGLAGLELLTSGDPPASASQSAGITGPFLIVRLISQIRFFHCQKGLTVCFKLDECDKQVPR